MNPSPRMRRLGEVIALFLKLGLTAFGGPAAHIGMMHDEVVERRKWLDEQQFLDLLGATNLIPGPNSTEMTIHIGFMRAGWPGLIAGGLCFILPAMLMVMIFAGVYVRYGSTPQAGWLLYGIKPVVIAIILQALWTLGRKAVKSPLTAAAGLASFSLYFLGTNDIALLLLTGAAVMIMENIRRIKMSPGSMVLITPFYWKESVKALTKSLSVRSERFNALFNSNIPGLAVIASAVPFSLPLLFLTFLKIGSVLYGSGYVLLAFLRSDFVVRLGWLTDQQLLDAIAVGQITPGPLFTSATFVGYLLGGIPGGLLATLGIFLPSFVFVAISNPFIPRLRGSPWAGALLDGVNAASLGLMAAVTVQLGRSSIVDPLTALLAAGTLFLLLRFKINSTWLIAGGALVGIARFLIGG
jgi:chromate transporter